MKNLLFPFITLIIRGYLISNQKRPRILSRTRILDRNRKSIQKNRGRSRNRGQNQFEIKKEKYYEKLDISVYYSYYYRVLCQKPIINRYDRQNNNRNDNSNYHSYYYWIHNCNHDQINIQIHKSEESRFDLLISVKSETELILSYSYSYLFFIIHNHPVRIDLNRPILYRIQHANYQTTYQKHKTANQKYHESPSSSRMSSAPRNMYQGVCATRSDHELEQMR